MNDDVPKLRSQLDTIHGNKSKLVQERIRLRAKIRDFEKSNNKLARENKKLDAQLTASTNRNNNLSKTLKLVRPRIASAERMEDPTAIMAELKGPIWDETQKFTTAERNEMRNTYLECVMHSDLILMQLVERSSEMFENEHEKFNKSLKKAKRVRQVRGLKITQGNIGKLDTRHILLLLMIRKHCKAPQMVLENIFKVDQTSISRYLTAYSKYFT